jgi:O-antigen/teichoic acid export membrane protein
VVILSLEIMKKVREIYKLTLNDKVFSGSLVMVIGGLLGSFTNYLYHLITARTLGPNDYGILDSLISLLYILLIPFATITLVVTKYVSAFKGQNRQKTIESFFWKLNRKCLYLAPFIFILIILATPLVVKFLHLPSPILFIIIGIYFLVSIFSSISRSFLQGLTRFFSLSFTGIIDGFFRLIFAGLFLSLGLGLLGAVTPFILAAILSLFFTLVFVKDLIKGKRNEPIPEKKEIVKFVFPVFMVNLASTSFITADVMLARHFLSSFDAGLYSALSTLGKIIYFAALPVTGVIFPIVSEDQAANRNVEKVILQGIFMIMIIILVIFLIFGLFPKMMVYLLFGEKYSSMIPYVVWIAMSMSLYTINFTLSNIFLSLKATASIFLICFASIAQITLIILFHQSISQIISISIIISALLLLTLLLYYASVRTQIRLEKNSVD